MKRDKTSQIRRFAAQCIFGGIALALVTFVGFRLGADVDTAAFAYLIVIVLLSLMGSFIASAALSIVAVACLDYFFAAPLFSFHVGSRDEVRAMIGFLTAAIIVTGLTAKVRKMAEEARTLQKELVETIPGLVWSALPDGSRDFHSQRWLKFTGLSATEAAGDGWIAVFHPEDRVEVVDKWRVAVATGGPFEAEGREQSANGEYRSTLVRAAPLRDERGTILRWYGSSTDIEDLKRAEEALRESEREWREVFEHNPVMYFLVDADGTVLSVNAFGAAQLGYTVAELVGQSVLSVFFEEDRGGIQRNVAVCLANLGQPNSWEVRKVRKDGMVIWVRENAKAVRRADDRLIVLVACEDITERKRTEDALRQSQMYLAEAQRISRTGSFGWRVDSGEMIWSEETFRIFECDRALKPTFELVLQRLGV
jgi:PAS domain S-box-containing protein